MKRNQLLAFLNAFPTDVDSQHAAYDETAWAGIPPNEIDEKERLLLRDFECDAYDLFQPIRNPQFVARELADASTTLSSSGLMDDLACPICFGICKEVMVVKDCSHRFCGSCIQKWLRQGGQDCPQCRLRIPSRRALRHDQIFDAIIQRLFHDVEGFERERSEIINEVSKRLVLTQGMSSAASIPSEGMQRRRGTTGANRMIDSEGQRRRRAASMRARDFIRAEAQTGREDQTPATSSREHTASRSSTSREVGSRNDEEEDEEEEEGEDDDEDASSGEPTSDDEEFDTNNSSPAARGTGRRRRTVFTSHVDHRIPPHFNDYSPRNRVEIFLVWDGARSSADVDLPSPLLNMARELSKRSQIFDMGASAQDVAMVIAHKIVTDVIGRADPTSLLPDITFVKDGRIYLADPSVQVVELSKSITESRGPTAVRYAISPRLTMLCNRSRGY